MNDWGTISPASNAKRQSKGQMKIGAGIGSMLKFAIVCGCIYAFVKWGPMGSQDGGNSEFAKQACADAINSRFDKPSVRINSVSKSDKGYVVRASITLRRDAPAMVFCLTNEYGGVEEIRVNER